MGIGEFFLSLSASAFGRWLANLLKYGHWKKQGAQEASNKRLEHSNRQTRRAAEIDEDVYSAAESRVDSRLSKYVRSDD